MAALEQYYFEPNIFQTPKMIALKIVKWLIGWKKIHFPDLMKDTKSVTSFSPSTYFELDRMTSCKHRLQ